MGSAEMTMIAQYRGNVRTSSGKPNTQVQIQVNKESCSLIIRLIKVTLGQNRDLQIKVQHIFHLTTEWRKFSISSRTL